MGINIFVVVGIRHRLSLVDFSSTTPIIDHQTCMYIYIYYSSTRCTTRIYFEFVKCYALKCLNWRSLVYLVDTELLSLLSILETANSAKRVSLLFLLIKFSFWRNLNNNRNEKKIYIKLVLYFKICFLTKYCIYCLLVVK